jgi:ATP-dependent DNA helicase DinG
MTSTVTSTQPNKEPDVAALLQHAVTELGGKHREGQLTMAAAVTHAIETGEHLAVQAGTGTGKSLAYLVPAIKHAVATGRTAVVSTATIALQRQLVDRDLPRLAAALKPLLGREPEFAILKGRNNYLCLHKLQAGAPEEPPEEALFDPFAISRLGRDVQRLTLWSAKTSTGDRDELVPGVTDQAWRQVSVSSRECLGVSRCPVGTDCFAEQARAAAGKVDVVVTNHALLAIDAINDINILPDHDVVIIDEAHELVDRVTGVSTAELSGATLSAAAKRSVKLVDERELDRLEASAEDLGRLLGELPNGQWQRLPDGATLALAAARDSAWAVRSGIGPPKPGEAGSPDALDAALAAIEDAHDTVVRILTAFDEPDPAQRQDVVWLSEDERRGKVLRIAPLSVAGLLRASLFSDATVVLTSATLTIGGSFDGLAAAWGLPSTTTTDSAATPDPGAATAKPQPKAKAGGGTGKWTGLDVGSPFDHARAGILYIASHLPPPGRDGLSPAYLDEIAALVEAAGGRTLGLFSSMRAAKAAAEAMRERLGTPVLCQGDDSTGQLVRKFSEDEPTSLFGTLSLWQGVDVPGPSLSQVILDRIPFPRPDDPLLMARQRAVEARGGNGFMTIAAAHAALLLAQGVGRLLRSVDDKGVISVLDPRLATARYGGFLRASLPPFWQTTNPEVVRAALSRIKASREQ